MSTSIPRPPQGPSPRPTRKRAPWHQWLVDAERGLTIGFRSDSVFFVHLFVGALAIATAGLLGLTIAEWAILVLALALTVAAEFFHQVLKQLGGLLAEREPEAARVMQRFAVAAVAATVLGSGTSIAILILSRLWTLFSA